MKARYLFFSPLLLACWLLLHSSFAATPGFQVLVFSKTVEFRHESIAAGKAAIAKMAQEKNFGVTFTEDARQFQEENLKKYSTVVFLNTTGDVLNQEQQNAFERYIQAGGGYVGVHAATDTEYQWPWYGKLVGAWFLDHPTSPSNVQKGRFRVVQQDHWATKNMPEEFEHADEFYSFRDISPKIHVVLQIDDKSYAGGKNPDFHPMSWYQEFDGGRSFYTALGHTDETFSEPLFLNHLWAGIHYAAGGGQPKPLDYSKARPEENRFTRTVLAERLDEPMELSVLPDGRILFIQRKGQVRLYNTQTRELKTIATIPVNLNYTNKEGKETVGEDGLLGLNKDPDFARNHWIYLYYSAAEASKNVLARFELQDDRLVMDSKKVLLEIPTTREESAHTGGSIAWDRQGNLYLSTGDNTNPHGSEGFSASDEREGRNAWDAQKSAANTNDLRGKILRIKPQPDGTYTIPEGNLFPAGSPQTRPEIYTMGHRNPFRISVDPKTGYVYWGEIGPDAAKADPGRGPAGHDEVGQARAAGNFGWPYFVGDNQAYRKYDFAASTAGDPWQANAPTNTSPNNTGLKVLPPAQKAFIWYPYGESKAFPLVGSGGRNAMAGPVFYTDEFKGAARAFPKYYDGKLFIYDWMRGWIMAVTMNKAGDYESMEPFMPGHKLANPMDMEFAANGDLYILEYGSGWFSANDDARLIRVEYNAGNRKPQLQVTANKTGGAVPFTLKLSAKGTVDADGDALRYSWKITSKNGFAQAFTTREAQVTLTKAGVYQATLTASDGKGGVSTRTLPITAGNEPPVLGLEMPGSNKSFYSPGKAFHYAIQVKDKEDGTLGKGIAPERVALNIDYLAEGYDQVAIAQGHRSADAGVLSAGGKKLIEASDCKGCHSLDKKSIGPAYREVAQKYQGDQTAQERLAKKIIAGGGGVWGAATMAAHPQLSSADAAAMVRYILSLSGQTAGSKALPLKGSYTASVPPGDKGRGVYILRAAYEDKGAGGLPALQATESLVLRNARVDVHGFDAYQDVRKVSSNGTNMVLPAKSGGYMLLKQIDLNAVTELRLQAGAAKKPLNMIGGKVEVRLGQPNGKLVGESPLLEPSEKAGFAPTELRVPIRLPAEAAGRRHDVYVVFVHPQPQPGTLMIVRGTEFLVSATGQ